MGPNLDPTRLQQRYQALRPYRFQLLAPRDRQRLENDPQALIDNALARVFGPFGLSGDQWRDDPLFLFEHYLQALAPFTLELEDGIPLATADGRYWALTTATVRAGGFALDTLQKIGDSALTAGFLLGFGVGDFDAARLQRRLLRNVTQKNRRSFARPHESLYMGNALVARKV